MWFKLVERLGLSYRNANELHSIIDDLPGRPPFQCRGVLIGKEKLQFHFCDILHCIRVLYGDPEFARDLVFAPERHYVDCERTQRVYSEMYTGDWWWTIQVRNTSSFRFLY